MRWIRLTDATTGHRLHVNMAQATSLERDEEQGTFIYIGQHYDDGNDLVYRSGHWVKETPDEILRLTAQTPALD